MMLLWFLACTAPLPERPASPGLLRLHAEGTTLVDAAGTPVVLRGVNLGGWMFHETWITAVDYPTWGRFYRVAEQVGVSTAAEAALRVTGPTDDLNLLEAALATEGGAEVAAGVRAETEAHPSVYDDSDLPLRTLLETRFGTAGRDALLDTFQGAWMTPSDIDAIADLGFNLVRLPVGYRSLVTNTDTEPPVSLTWNEAAFDRLTALLDACAEARIYVVLDIQESPGGHNDYSGDGTLYTDPAMQALTVQLWEELSVRYRDRDGVAAYSLLAEPMSAPSVEASMAMYDQLYDAIRAQDDDHLLIIHDGFRGMWSLPAPETLGWEDVIYSTHLFEWGASSREDYAAIIALYDLGFGNAQETQGVPYFIGSFSTMEDADWAYAAAGDLVDWYDERGWSWAWWTWKRIDDPLATQIWGEQTGWGLLREPWPSFTRPDVWQDPEAVLRERLGTYNGEMTPNPRLTDAIAPTSRE